jgi:YVTN family beta-propeller protein
MHVGHRHLGPALASVGFALVLGAAPWLSTAAAADTGFTRIRVGELPTSIAVNPTTNRVYVSNFFTQNLSILDGTTNTVAATLPLGFAPRAVTVDSVKNRVYAAGVNQTSGMVAVTKIDGQSNNVIVGPVPVFGPITSEVPVPIADDPADDRLYVADATRDLVQVVSLSAVPPIAVGAYPDAMVFDAATNRVYVANGHSNNVSVIDTQSNKVVATILVGGNPQGIALNTRTDRIFVTNTGDNTVSVISTASNSVVATLPAGPEPIGVAADPVTNRIIVGNYDGSDRTVTIIDTAQNVVLTPPPAFGDFPYAVAVNPSMQRAYVSLSSESSVAVLPNDGVVLQMSAPGTSIPVGQPVPVPVPVPAPMPVTPMPLVGH